MEKEIYIFDTDMDTDCDDVGALVMLLKYAKKGLIDLRAIVTDAPSIGGAPICELLCNYYGYHCDIGAIYESQYPVSETDRYKRYRYHRTTLPDSIYYNRHLLSLINKTDVDYRPSFEVYRKTLASCPDKSVTIVGVGFYSAIEELLHSSPDKYSPLNGYDLFHQKVKRVISMGKAEDDGHNFNYAMDREGAKMFINTIKVPIYFSPDGTQVITGYDFTDKLVEDNPLRMAYEIYCGGPNKGRMSWDLIATYYALGIDNSIFDVYSKGRVNYNDEDHITYWLDDKRRTDYEININISNQEMAQRLENILTED